MLKPGWKGLEKSELPWCIACTTISKVEPHLWSPCDGGPLKPVMLIFSIANTVSTN